MKTMIMIETEAEREIVREVWENMMRDLQDGHRYYGCNTIHGAISYNLNDDLCVLDCDHAIVYDRHSTEDGQYVWDIYNFATKKMETVEGDLAGLANSWNGNFPFFN